MIAIPPVPAMLNALPMVFKIANTAAAILPYVCKTLEMCIGTLGRMHDVLKPGEKAEVFGFAMQNATKAPKEFENVNSYVEYLRDEIKAGNININENKDYSIVDKVAGNALIAQAVGEKYGLDIGATFWGIICQKASNEKLNANEISGILTQAKTQHINPDNIANYIAGNNLESNIQKSEVSSLIIDGLKHANPTMSNEDITDRFNTLLKKD
ncbi:MAG: hypothetical protein SPJ16_07945 [Helicobacter sp.]|uniref:hypothetical protein n=1 Tax=Helicobacter sp. TaxID=218 RepID=UPI002A91BADA|nr:hypothetical protein [Helicobacter sp.]MDY5951102.1 hypothetical protein [Helicobacter sp.]